VKLRVLVNAKQIVINVILTPFFIYLFILTF